MKKTIAILLVAVLAAGSVFAGFSGSADLTAGFDIDAKKYGFIGQGTEVKVAFDVTTGEGAASGEGDIYAAIKGTFKLEVKEVKAAKYEDNVPVKLTAKISEAGIYGSNWSVSIIGDPKAPDYAKSAIDKDSSDDKNAYDYVPAYNDGDAYGVTGTYADYAFGVTLTGVEKQLNAGATFETKKFDLNGLTVKAGASASKKAGAGVLNTSASADVAYATDTLSASVKADLGLAIPTNEAEKLAFGADVQVAAKYSDIAFDVYYATKATTKVDTTGINNLLSAQVVAPLAQFNVPVTVTAGVKDAVNKTDIFGKVVTTVDKFEITVGGNFAVQPKTWGFDAAVKYSFTESADVTAKVGYTSAELLSASVVATSTGVINGATVTAGWDGAKDLLDKDASKANYGKLFAKVSVKF